MQHIDVVCALLQQQPGGVPAFGMPVMEIGVAAIADEMAAPGALDLADDAAVDEFLHLQDGGVEAHVMPDVELAAVFHGAPQNALAAFDGDCQRLFQIDMLSGLEGGACHLLVEEIRGDDEHGIDLGHGQQLTVVGEGLRLGECGGERRQRPGVGVRAGGNHISLAGEVVVPAKILSAAAGADDAEPDDRAG